MAKGCFFIGVLLWTFTGLGLAGDRIPVNSKPPPIALADSLPPVGGQPLLLTKEEKPDSVQPCIREKLVMVSRSQIGVRQVGDNTGPEVDMYLRSVGIEPPAFWCAAFVGWVFQQLSLDIPRSAAWSPAWFPASRVIANEHAQMGDVGGIYFRSLGRIAHVFIYDEHFPRKSNFVLTIEGNTNDDGSRNGHSVLRKRRSLNQIHRSASWI